jgi:hypothetical protein
VDDGIVELLAKNEGIETVEIFCYFLGHNDV